MSIDYLVKNLELQPHPEGGFYREMYRSEAVVPSSVLQEYPSDRSLCTSIYFLLTSENFSAFHRIKQDEIWHFYGGTSLFVHVIDPDGNYTRHTVGMDLENGAVPQLVVPGGCWFASSVKNADSYSFVGCTVAPGFDFEDFELATYKNLAGIYPQHQEVIRSLTRE